MKLIYRHYATLYFVFAVDQQESDLGILDLIQGRLDSHLIRHSNAQFNLRFYSFPPLSD